MFLVESEVCVVRIPAPDYEEAPEVCELSEEGPRDVAMGCVGES